MTVEDIVTQIAPELNVNDILQFVGIAETRVSLNFDSNMRDQAVAYLTAHLMTLSKRNGNSGSVSQLSEGQLSVSFAVNNSTSTSLNSTVYGQEYLTIIRNSIGTTIRSGVMM